MSSASGSRLAWEATTPTPQDPLEKLFQKVAAGEPAELRKSYLALPDPRRPQFAGTGVPALLPMERQRPSGLFVVSSVEDSRLDSLMKPYVFGSDIDVPVTVGELDLFIRGHDPEDLYAACAQLMAELFKDTPSSRAAQLRLVQTFTTGSTRRLAEAAVQDGRVFLAPQLVLMVAKAAIYTDPHPTRLPADTALQHAIVCSLAAGEYFVDTDREDEPTAPGELPMALILEIARNQEFNSTTDVGTLLARYARFRELADARDGDLARRLDEIFEEATGTTAGALFDVGMTAWMAMEGENTVRMNRIRFDQLQHSTEHVDRALDLLATDISTLRSELRAEIDQRGLDWSINTLRRYPMLRCGDGTFVALHRGYLLERACGSGVFWETRQALNQQANRGSKSSRRRAKQLFGLHGDLTGHVAEDYAAETFATLVGSGGVQAKRLWREADLQPFVEGDQCCDLLVDGSTAWIAVEVVNHQLTAEAATNGTVEDFYEDVRCIVEDKAQQIHSLIHRMMAAGDTVPDAGLRSASVTYYPVIVAAAGFPFGPPTADLVRRRLREVGLLQHPRIAPLTVISLGELEHMESAVETGKIGLLEIFERRRAEGNDDMPMDSWLYNSCGLLYRPERLTKFHEASFDHVIESLGFNPAEIRAKDEVA